MSTVSRRVLLRTVSLAPLAGLAGCDTFGSLFETDKKTLAGKREAVLEDVGALATDPTERRPVALPAAARNADWTQAGGNPAHVVGNISVGSSKVVWSKSIGEGGGYRAKITATPVIASGRIFTMDSDGVVSSFDAATGDSQWNTVTQAEDDRSTNVGGGLALAGKRVFATTGRGNMLALDMATGTIIWRSSLGAPARSAPTIVEGHAFVATLDGRVVALNTDSGSRLWNYQASATATSVLGEPAPAYADGTLICGFGSGDLVALRADSGTMVWSDSLGAARGRNSLLDLSAIRALPLIADNVVYAVGMGGLMLALDLRSGRRLWERDIGSLNTPWLAGDWLFVVTLGQTLVCLNRADGHVRWSSQLPRYEDPDKQADPIFWTGPFLGGDYMYLAGSTAKMIAVNPANGEILGEQELPDKIAVAPIGAMGRMFIVTEDGLLSAFG